MWPSDEEKILEAGAIIVDTVPENSKERFGIQREQVRRSECGPRLPARTSFHAVRVAKEFPEALRSAVAIADSVRLAMDRYESWCPEVLKAMFDFNNKRKTGRSASSTTSSAHHSGDKDNASDKGSPQILA